MKAPAFQFYADDFIGGTVCMTAEEVGSYVRLLCFQWGNGEIPRKKEVVDRIAGCAVSVDVMAKFPNQQNARMENERAKQEAFRANRSESGKAGAERRWHSHSTANGLATVLPLANGMAKDSSPSPSPISVPVTNSVPPEDDPPAALSPKAAKVRAKAKTETDEEWISGLEKMECFRLTVIRDELGLAQSWCAANNRQCTRQFFNRWLLRSVEKVRTISTNGNKPKHRTEADRDRDRTGLQSTTVGANLKSL